MINIAEVWIANGTGILLMVFFLLTRKWNKDNNSFGERVFNGMVWLALTGCAKKMRWLRIPLVIDALLLCVNAIHPGFLFTISVKNVYIRGPYVWRTYPCVVFYCVMSVIHIIKWKSCGCDWI